MLMGIREVRTLRNQIQMGFRVPDIVAGETATGLHYYEKDTTRYVRIKHTTAIRAW